MANFDVFRNEMTQIFNKKSAQHELISFFDEKFQKQFWYLSDYNRSINEFIKENPKEHAVLIGTGVGILSEKLIEHIFNKFKSKTTPTLFNINSSQGDYIFDGKSIELKSTKTRFEKNRDTRDYFSGSTHSFSKTDKFLFIKYDLETEKAVNEGSLVKGVCIFSLKIDKNLWKGKPTKKNSFTAIRFPINMKEDLKNGLIYGNIKDEYSKNAKYLKFYCENIC